MRTWSSLPRIGQRFTQPWVHYSTARSWSVIRHLTELPCTVRARKTNSLFVSADGWTPPRLFDAHGQNLQNLVMAWGTSQKNSESNTYHTMHLKMLVARVKFYCERSVSLA